MADHSELYGSCACERNQYTVIIPSTSASLAHVFFSNSAANRRSQATPVTAWLRVPLAWYHSSTHAHFPDETHTAIRRTFDTPPSHTELPPTRRVFCGYCGTHLTAWSEGHDRSEDFVNVTLGSLLSESIDQLEALSIIPSTPESEEEDLVEGGTVNEEDHIPATGDANMEGADEAAGTAVRRRSQHSMQDRGLPYFEEMVENSRLGRIKRQKGGHTSLDGRTTVHWEVVEIDGDGGSLSTTIGSSTADELQGGRNKRQKLGV